MKHRLTYSASVLTLVFFGWYWVSITMYGHIHDVDGATFVHSHPFTSGDGHQHSESNIATIGILSNPTLWSICDNVVLEGCCLEEILEIIAVEQNYIDRSSYDCIGLRAPPIS